MLSKHRGLHITSPQRLRFVTLLSRAADDAGLPADPKFRAAVMGYAECLPPPLQPRRHPAPREPGHESAGRRRLGPRFLYVDHEGSKTGRRRRNPVVVVEYDGRHWLVAPYRPISWVHNAPRDAAMSGAAITGAIINSSCGQVLD
jgi:hypothetical protein